MEINGNARTQAIVNKNVMPLFQQISGNGKNSLRNHAIGDIGNIAMTGKPVKSPRVNKNYAFFDGFDGVTIFHGFQCNERASGCQSNYDSLWRFLR